MKSPRRAFWITVTGLSLIGSVLYYGFIGRAEATNSQHGWLLNRSYTRWACHVCSSRVERLAYKGQPILVPQGRSGVEGAHNGLDVSSPVGWFFLLLSDTSSRWYWRGDPHRIHNSDQAISQEELARGYYEADDDYDPEHPGIARKQGTPESWCLIRPANESDWCWISPEMIHLAPWAAGRRDRGTDGIEKTFGSGNTSRTERKRKAPKSAS